MKRKILSILLTLVLVLSFSLVMAVPVAAQVAEVWVDDDFTSGTTGWGETHFATIQEGITAVDPGGTINVVAGEYNERLTINKSLDLRGAQYEVDPTATGARTTPADESVITEAGLPDPNPNLLIGIANGVSGVTIDGFTLIGDPTDTTADTSVIRCGSNGTANDITISNNVIDGRQDIIYKGGDTLVVHQNRMVANKNGVVVQPNAATDVTISDNVFTLGSTPGGDEVAIYMTSCSQSSVTRNTATGFVNGRGLAGSYLDHLTVSGNTFTGNKDAISIWGDSMVITISNNLLSESLYYGIEIKGQDLSIKSNQIINNGDIGVYIDRHTIDTERVTVSNNNIVGNTNFGVWVNTAKVTETVDATNNWWGHASGPSGEDGRVNKAGKVVGKGDAVSGNVDWDPWLPQPIKHTPHDPVPPGLEDHKAR